MPSELQIEAAKEEHKYYPYTGIFFANRHSFWAAGQDSFTLPPAQNPDLFMQLVNVEPVTRGILQRRRGYTLFSNLQNVLPPAPYSRAMAFRSEALSLRRLVWTSPGTPTTPGAITATDESGSVILNPIFTPAINARAARMVLSRDFGYFADGVAADYKKWDGTQPTTSLTNWGIALNPGSAGPNDASMAVDEGSSGTNGSQGPSNCGQGSNQTGVGTSVWFNPTNITSPGNSANASASNNNSVTTNYLTATNFGFNIPVTATIQGLLVSISRRASVTGTGSASDNIVSLTKSGTAPVGGNLAQGVSWPATFTTANYGSSTNLWGTTWLPADINSSNFGVMLSANLVAGAQSAVSAQVTAFVTITVYYSTPSGFSWTNVNGSFANNPLSPATTPATVGASSDLRDTGFGFALAPSTVIGIQVAITCQTSGGQINLNPVLVKAGVPSGLRKTAPVTSTSFSPVTFGGQFDLWGSSWAFSDINSATFGVQFNVSTLSGTATFSVDRVQVTVFTQAGSITLGATSAGAITLISGRTYFFTFNNSKTGHNSTLSAASASTGPLTNQQQLLTGIPVPADPQVDTVLILATADGNDQTTLFLLGSVSAGTTTFPDNTPDTVLLTNAVYQQTDAIGQLHGVANNNPPPTADFPIKHKGRMYMAQGHNLFFSKSLDDVTTSTGSITGKWEEAWPFTNAIDLSEFSETIKALLSDGETLWIGTERNIRRLIGDGPLNFQKPEIQFNECGVLNPEVWRVVFYEGQPVGTMWMTPDFRVMSSDFNTYRDVGTPIQDVLNTINPLALTAAHAMFVSKQAFDLYMLYIPTGSNTLPDTICVYNLRTGKWCIWQPADQTSASVFNIDVNGNPQWLFAAQAGPLYFWDSAVLQDRNGNSPVSYPVTMQTSWLDLGDYTLRKFVNQIIPTTADQSGLTIQVEAASNELDFNNPLLVVGPTTVTPAAIPTDVFVPLASGPSHSRAFRFTFVSPASTIQNILTGFSVEAGSFHKYLWWLFLGGNLLRFVGHFLGVPNAT